MQKISFTLNGVSTEVPFVDGKYKLKYPCGSDKTNCWPFLANIPPGNYRFILHGASGGTPKADLYGSGGYCEGIVSFQSTTPTYFFIGSEGTTKSDSEGQTQTSFNGGGAGFNSYSATSASSGGGGTDIRLFEPSLNHRILVAGGGGGTGYYEKFMKGGSGGDSVGIKGEDYDSSDKGGNGGTQTSGGSTVYCESGSFGYGGNTSCANGCGGGGGWFGGGSGGYGLAAGGGGSGFVFNSTNEHISLNSRYYVSKGETRIGTNKGDGQIEIEPLTPNRSPFITPYQTRTNICLTQIQINSKLFVFTFTIVLNMKFEN